MYISVDKMGDEEIIAWVLNKMARHGWWEGKHTNIDNIPKGAPPHAKRKVKESIKYLIKLGFIIKKPTNYGVEISLNFRRKSDIFDIIEKSKD